MKKIVPALLIALLLTGCSQAAEETDGGGLTAVQETDAQTADSGLSDEDVDADRDEPEESSETEALSETETQRSASTEPELTEPDSAKEAKREQSDARPQYDIRLWASEKEILIGRDNSEIIWYAEIPVDCEPDVVYLIDADTEEIAAELRDEADYEKYGDTIKGDSVYNCRFQVNTEIDTDPDVSEEAYYHYYVEFTENNITHRSETTEIWVLEQLTDKELSDMEAVDTAIDALMDSPEYQALSDSEKEEQVLSLLGELAAQGTPECPYSLIDPNSICMSSHGISFEYTCGIGGGVMIRDFDPMMN